MTRILAAAGMAIIAPPMEAQPPTQGSVCPYEQCAVRTEIGLFSEYLVRGEGAEKVVRINFTGSNAAAYLGRVESAASAARRFQSSRTRGAVLGMIGGAALGYASAAIGLREEARIETAEVIALSVGLPAAIWGGIETMRSRNALSRAIMQFNRSPVY
jgi:hypothetical protein